MNRREFLQCATILVSGIGASGLGFALSEEQQNYLAAAPNYNAGEVNFLSQEQRRVLSAMCEIVIPRTDTPGAIDAGVPRFVELMARDWLTEGEQSIFNQGLQDLIERTAREHGTSFDQLDAPTQQAIMEAMEEQASDSSWYEFGNLQRDFVSDAPFICQVKELTIWGFFTSEVGSTQVLQYNPMPMYFDGEVPLGPNDSTSVGHIR